MSYATVEMLVDRFGAALLERLTDRADPPAGEIDSDVIARALADTDALIDGYLAGRYRLPLAEIPRQIPPIALAIAIYKLHVYSPEEKIARDFEAALKSLREIAAGTIILTAETLAPQPTGGTGARITDRARPLTEKNLKGWI